MHYFTEPDLDSICIWIRICLIEYPLSEDYILHSYYYYPTKHNITGIHYI